MFLLDSVSSTDMTSGSLPDLLSSNFASSGTVAVPFALPINSVAAMDPSMLSEKEVERESARERANELIDSGDGS